MRYETSAVLLRGHGPYSRGAHSVSPNDTAQRQLTRTIACSSARAAGSTGRCSELLDDSSRSYSLLQRLLRYQVDTLAFGLGNYSQTLV